MDDNATPAGVYMKLVLVALLWLGVFVLGALGVAITNLCFMYGLQTVSAARASLIFALIPAATLLGDDCSCTSRCARQCSSTSCPLSRSDWVC